MISFATLPELSLYIHLPWCERKCPYCDFNSHAFDGLLEEDRYLDALIADLEVSLPLIWGRPVVSVFIGGGTPSLFSPDAIARLLAAIRARVKLLPDAEITLEANPGTMDGSRFAGYADAGVNRLSVGVQSFSDKQLLRLGRIHNVSQARQAIASALGFFQKVNLDLMFGLPGQSLHDLGIELREAIGLGVSHLSCYQLTLEPNTRFANNPPADLPDDDLLADMQAMVVEDLAAVGLNRYEISAYAKSGHQCRHNLNYWTFGDYLGIGAGAHGKISFSDRIVRTQKRRTPNAYMLWAASAAKPPVQDLGGQTVQPGELPFEFMLNALRLIEGVPIGRWKTTTGMAIGDHPFLLERLGRAQRLGLLSRDPSKFQATPRGLELLNDLQSLFLE